MRAGKIAALVAGSMLALIALALLVNGGWLLSTYDTQRDGDGFFVTSTRVLSTNGSALVTPEAELNMGPLVGHWLPTGARSAFRIAVTSIDDTQLFLGVGPGSDLTTYLEAADYDEVTDFGWGSSSVICRQVDRHVDATVPTSPPGGQDFWVARDEGSNTLALDWDISDGNWTAVVMNADGSAPVRAEVTLGARFDRLLPIGIGVTISGVVLLGLGVLVIVLGARRPPDPALRARVDAPHHR